MNSIALLSQQASAPYPLTPVDGDVDADIASTPAALSSGSGGGGRNVDAVATDFEAVFLTQMMGAMFSGDDLTSFFGGGSTGEIYKGYLMNEFGKAMAKSGGIGIAAHVKQELLSLQEVKP